MVAKPFIANEVVELGPRRYAQGYTKQAIDCLAGITADRSLSDGARVAAARLILEIGWGN